MNTAVNYRRATPADILAILIEDHRHQTAYDSEADPDAVLTFETRVSDWRRACDLMYWVALGRAMNWQFGTSFSEQQWRSVLKPGRRRTLRDVCDLIATRALLPELNPIRVFGKSCKTAGAFLILRSLLAERGVRVDDIRPSSDTAPILREHFGAFLNSVARLAPGRLPRIEVEVPGYDACARGIFVGIGMCLLGWLLSAGSMGVGACVGGLGMFVWIASYIGTWMTAGSISESVAFGDIRTFRELCVALTDQRTTEHRP